jgi:hypothetical protein
LHPSNQLLMLPKLTRASLSMVKKHIGPAHAVSAYLVLLSCPVFSCHAYATVTDTFVSLLFSTGLERRLAMGTSQPPCMCIRRIAIAWRVLFNATMFSVVLRRPIAESPASRMPRFDDRDEPQDQLDEAAGAETRTKGDL